MSVYLDADNGKDSWDAKLFCRVVPPVGKCYTVKQLKQDYGFNPWLGAAPPIRKLSLP